MSPNALLEYQGDAAMVAHARKLPLTPEEYLERERSAEVKSEYWDGVLAAMAGGTEEHDYICGNLFGNLYAQLRGTPCTPFTGNMSVHIPAFNRYVYPDASVACGEARFVGIRGIRVLTNPVLVVEVQSPSTEDIDRAAKFDGYRTIASLSTYLLVSQDAPRIEVWTRQTESLWQVEIVSGLDAMLSLPAIGCSLPLSQIYQRVTFPPPPEIGVFRTEEG